MMRNEGVRGQNPGLLVLHAWTRACLPVQPGHPSPRAEVETVAQVTDGEEAACSRQTQNRRGTRTRPGPASSTTGPTPSLQCPTLPSTRACGRLAGTLTDPSACQVALSPPARCRARTRPPTAASAGVRV